MMGIITATNDEFDYADCFDPGEGKQAVDDPGKQHHGDFLAPETEKWKNKDCPLCYSPFSVRKMRSRDSGCRTVWFCTHCRRRVA